ncbi:hypothetical protein [Chitinivorax sp. B]|uniref:hypothetical protein n=1 Tax=Chitinivorax sp. B TaxID=2502235 RepID=UPI0010FA45D0|nr:hypothetical protein [Chitinivorax sp. B]
MRWWVWLWFFAVAWAHAAQISADPSSYLDQLKRLKPGDELLLEPGSYTKGLPLFGLVGEPDRPIIISGAGPNRTRLVAQAYRNTVSIADSAHLIVRNMLLDGQGLPADGVRAEGNARWAHHITLENLAIVNHGANQGYVGISTKCPAWGWVIRNNRIIGAGTGLYLGNSDGRAPFIGGLIEENLIVGSLGYNLQIKHQATRPNLVGMPEGRSVTVIRRNVLVKAVNSSRGKDARPSMLVGHWPLEGTGQHDRYDIYGNLFYGNPSEALFQGEGNLALYNNLFVNPTGDAINIQPHNDVPRQVYVFHNTVLAAGNGIYLRNGLLGASYPQYIQRNAVFATYPVQGGEQAHNVIGNWQAAASHLRSPFARPGKLRLDPLPGKLQISEPPLEWMVPLTDAKLDYDGRQATRDYIGAYADSAKWPLGLRHHKIIDRSGGKQP